MGEVFLAEDPSLGRKVAIKRAAPSSLTAEQARARLRHEAHAAAQLHHPNVAFIYDVMDSSDPDDPLYIVMEYVEGETLARVIARAALAPEAAVAMARQIADALVHAHAHGVIHRDLKPANVMVTTHGKVKVLDFGLARDPLVDTGSGDHSSIASQVYGTPGYMAPEQLMGKRGDARSDIYSFGALLFELVTGQRPFKGADRLERVLTGGADRPPEPRVLNARVPERLNALIVRALAIHPEARFQTAGELRDALERVWTDISEAPTTAVDSVVAPRLPARRRRQARAAFLLAVAAVAAPAALMYWRAADAPAGAPPVVAVLPFDVPAGDPELEPLSAGLSELIMNGLASTNAVTVPAPAGRSFSREAGGENAAEVAKALGASHLIEGAVRRTPAGVELSIRIGSTGDAEGWQRSYPGQLDEVLTIARRILGDVVVELGAASQAPRSAVTSVQAFQQYSQARSFLERGDIPGNYDRAIQLLQAAIAQDPNFALAHAALGETYWEKYRKTRDRQLVDQAKQSIMLALSIDARQPLVRYSLAMLLYGTGDRARAEKELQTIVAAHPLDQAHKQLGIMFIERGENARGLAELQRAIDLRPGFSGHYVTKAIASLKLGRYAEADALLELALQLQPDNAAAYAHRGTAALLRGHHEQAIAWFQRSLKTSPDGVVWSNLGTAYTDAQRHDEALTAFRQAALLRPSDALLQRNLGDMLARAGRRREARDAYAAGVRAAREAVQINANAPEAHGALAICLAKLGEFDEALRHAETAIKLAPSAYEPYYRRAGVLVLAGRKTEALAALREAFARGISMALVSRDDDFRLLRETQEFKDLVPRPRVPVSPGG